MPSPHDPSGALLAAGVAPSVRLEGLNAAGEWECVYRGNEQKVLLRGLPPNILGLARVRVSLDLRRCVREGSGAITIADRVVHNSSGGAALDEFSYAPTEMTGNGL